jgi:tetratricopeptide (TPR) repeat protein
MKLINDELASSLQDGAFQDWNTTSQKLIDACKSALRIYAPSQDRQSSCRISLKIAMPLVVPLTMLVLVASTAPAFPKQESSIVCPESIAPAFDLANDPLRLDLLTRQATACVRARRPARAVALLTEIIRQKPTDPFAYLNRGSAQATAGEMGLAISDFTTAINLKADLVEAWYDRGTTFTHLRRYQNAVADFTETIRLKPDFALAYCNRGLASFQLGDYDRALVDYSVAIEYSDKLNYCYLNRGTLYLVLGEYQKAIDDLTQALGDKPSDAIALSRRGQAHEALGQVTQALDDFRAAIEANPNLESAKEGFSRITAQQHRSETSK